MKTLYLTEERKGIMYFLIQFKNPRNATANKLGTSTSTLPSRLKKVIYVKNLTFHLEGWQRELFVFLRVILKMPTCVCFRQCCDPDPDPYPHGSRIFAWIRI